MHTHTTASDGLVTPQEAIDGYAAEGYDFLAITDHERVTDTSALDHRGLTLLPGTEISVGENDTGRPFHLVGVGMSAMPEFDSADAQGALDALAAVSQFTFIAHPSWSDVTFAHILTLTGADAVEVFNTGCQREMGRGLDEIPWDDCLARGSKLMAVAVDDCHWKIPDAYGGWVMVWAEDRSPDAICAALRAGRYYSSTGPTMSARNRARAGRRGKRESSGSRSRSAKWRSRRGRLQCGSWWWTNRADAPGAIPVDEPPGVRAFPPPPRSAPCAGCRSLALPGADPQTASAHVSVRAHSGATSGLRLER